jgi:hypothetical protein
VIDAKGEMAALVPCKAPVMRRKGENGRRPQASASWGAGQRKARVIFAGGLVLSLSDYWRAEHKIFAGALTVGPACAVKGLPW